MFTITIQNSVFKKKTIKKQQLPLAGPKSCGIHATGRPSLPLQPLQKHCNIASIMWCFPAKDFKASTWHHGAIPFFLTSPWQTLWDASDFETITHIQSSKKKNFGAVRDVMTGTIVTKKNVLKYTIDPVALILPFRKGVDRVYNNCVSCFQEWTSGYSVDLFMRRMVGWGRDQRENTRHET